MFVDHPSEAGIYEILRGCIEELVRSELIAIGPRILTYRSLCDAMGLNESTFIESHRLLKIARCVEQILNAANCAPGDF